VALLLVLGSVQLGVWGSEAYAVRQAAVAGARAATGTGGSAAVAAGVALATLRPALVGAAAGSWCPGAAAPPPPVWVCVTFSPTSVEVRISGSVPGLVPLPPSGGLPVAADVVMAREVFQ
jgi:hypothetical protein